MTNTVKVENKGEGNVSLNDINQTVIINNNNNIKNILDEFNEVALRKGNDFSKFYAKIEDPNSFFYNISRKNLFLRNTFFSQKDIYFGDIYVPLDIKLSENLVKVRNNEVIHNEKITIDDNFLVEKIINDNIVNIVGWAGQGKSTVLCKMFINQIHKGSMIPIFLSFRNINHSILIELHRLFKDSNIECSEGDIVALLRSKKILLILDAFDEIRSDDLKFTLTNEIKRMQQNYGLAIICSSRPGTYLCDQVGIENYNLQEIQLETIVEIINKTRAIPDDKDKILNLLNTNKNVQKSLRTPLLTILFVKIYPDMEIIPQHAKDFYDQIFNLLYSSHDKSKQGNQIYRSLNKRYKHSDTKFTFSLLSFISFLNNRNSFNLDIAEEYISSGINTFKNKIPKEIIGLDSNLFLRELIECTSLLIYDGLDNGKDLYSFLHKTIQEYYAAHFFKEFIKNETSSEQLEFFIDFIKEKMFSDPTYIVEFLKFISVLDINFTRDNILIPFLEKYFYHQTKNIDDMLLFSKNILEDSILASVNFKVVSQTEQTEQMTNTHLILDKKLSRKNSYYYAQETTMISLSVDSKIREIIRAIAYIFDLDSKIEELFSKLMSEITNFKATDIFPLSLSEESKLERGNVVKRDFQFTFNDLKSKKNYKETYKKVTSTLDELNLEIYDIYKLLKFDESQFNSTDNNPVESLKGLFR